jgi:hypothetical protein
MEVTIEQQALAFLAAFIAIGLASLLCLVEWMVRKGQGHKSRAQAAWLNQHRPGCFMACKPWEDKE